MDVGIGRAQMVPDENSWYWMSTVGTEQSELIPNEHSWSQMNVVDIG